MTKLQAYVQLNVPEVLCPALDTIPGATSIEFDILGNINELLLAANLPEQFVEISTIFQKYLPFESGYNHVGSVAENMYNEENTEEQLAFMISGSLPFIELSMKALNDVQEQILACHELAKAHYHEADRPLLTSSVDEIFEKAKHAHSVVVEAWTLVQKFFVDAHAITNEA